MRTKPSDAKRKRWRASPLARAGISYSRRDQARIRALYEAGDIAGAQRIILDLLHLEIEGPPFRVTMAGGRKRLVLR